MNAVAILERAVAFLLAQQGQDGLWRDFRTVGGEAADWPSGFIAAQLVAAGVPYTRLESAARALVIRQHRDGGWGYHRGLPTDADSTAWVLLFLCSMRQVDNSVLIRAAECLLTHMDQESGGVRTYRDPDPIRNFMDLEPQADISGWCCAHLEVTAVAGRAFAAVGGAFLSAASKAWRYVESGQRDDGSWHSYWWTSPFYATLQAVYLGRAIGNWPCASIEKAIAWAEREPRADGGFSDSRPSSSAFATALGLSLLRLANRNSLAIESAMQRLAALQGRDGSWPSQPSLRIPPPGEMEPDKYTNWRMDGLGSGVVIRDQYRLFTTAACAAALATPPELCP